MAQRKINPPSVRRIKWTQQQNRAIAARGSDILVTASAGTGKTAVLSGRCVDIVSDKSTCPNVWSILVLTFTDMAAEEMRSRIAEQLQEAIENLSDDSQDSKFPAEGRALHLYQQLILLQGADISTIHSFCKRLITECFYKLGLDPTFRVIDADEARLLKAEILEKTIDWAWKQDHLTSGLQQLLSRRDLRTNDGFLAKIIDLSDFLDGVVSKQNWLHRASILSEQASVLTSELGKKQKQIITKKLQQILDQLYQAQSLCRNESPDNDWPEKLQDSHIKPVKECIKLLKDGDWDKFTETIRNFKKPKTSTPKDILETAADLLHDIAKKAIDKFEKLSQLAILNPDYLDKLSGSVTPQTQLLIELVERFDEFYSQAKRAVNCLDFADLEHYALKLLARDINAEDLEPSETALSLRRKYKYIFVDEYQDINPVQKAILKILTTEGNLFVVGDVKQSIYAWRGAEPKIFIDDLKSACPDPEAAPRALRVDLNTNFRSNKKILDFVNKIFSRIMTSSFADIDYDESACLKPAELSNQLQVAGHAVEFHILDETSIDQESQNEQENEYKESENLSVISAQQRQAAFVAQRIRQIVGVEAGKAEFQIYDKQLGCMRDVEYRDIVVLMRSLAKKANDYVEIFRLAGIPVSCQATAGYFETTEITDMLSLLKVLDNPQRDIELAAVLRSPFFKITDTELAEIKTYALQDEGKKGQRHKGTEGQRDKGIEAQSAENFYECVLRNCQSGADAKLANKLSKVLARIEEWRTIARRGQLADLVWQIYRHSGFLSFVSALPNGQARRANLLKLHDRAIQFEGFATSTGIPSLTRFVEFIQKLQEIGQDWAPAEPPQAAGNAVRILSIHKSKGLEFPVVFLTEMQSEFNLKDTYADCIVDAADTLGLQIIDPDSNTKLPTLAHQVIAKEKRSTALAEELRILYVATTRARDRLILTASQKRTNCRQILTTGISFSPCCRTVAAGGQEPIPDWLLDDCKNPLQWILYGLCDQKSLHTAFQTGLEKQTLDGDLFSFKLYGQVELEQLSKYVRQLRANKLIRPAHSAYHDEARRMKDESRELLSQVKNSLSWQYPFADAPFLPAKQSVTQLTHRNDEYIKFDYSRALDRQPIAVTAEVELTEPQAKLIGSATHLLIAQLDLTKPITKDAIEKTKEKLLNNGSIAENIADYIDIESILNFFQSELGQIALDKQNSVHREWPFTFALPASEFPLANHEHRLSAVALTKAEASLVRRLVRRSASEVGSFSEVGSIEHRDTIIVQGIIDMLIQTQKDLVVIDFKTDDITAEQASERAELYHRQLDLYGRAAEAIQKSKILSKWLYFLAPSYALEIK